MNKELFTKYIHTMNKLQRLSEELIEYMKKYEQPQHIVNFSKFLLQTEPKYQFLKDRYFPIFHAIITKKITDQNKYILCEMINQKKEIDDGQISLSAATNNVSDLLSKECNIDKKYTEKQEGL